MGKKFTHEEVKEIINISGENKYELMEEPRYSGINQTIHIKHLDCDTISPTTLKKFKLKIAKGIIVCKKCNRKGYTHEMIRQFILDYWKGEYELTDKTIYKDCDTWIYVKHNKCNTIFKTKWTYMKENYNNNDINCSYCNCKHNSFEKIAKRISTFNDGQYVLTKELPYISGSKPIVILDLKCNNTFITTYNNLRINNKQKCESCTHCQRRKYNNKIINKELYNYSKGEYILSTKKNYVSSNKTIYFIHKECNHEFPVIWDNVRKQLKLGVCICPKCKKYSRGEEIIKNYLDKNNINSILQYSDENCKSENDFLLKYDFFLPNENIYIEFDGAQHFKNIKGWGGIERLEKQKRNDRIKNHYCKNNQSFLIRIPYNQIKNIDNILNSFLNNNDKKSFLIDYYKKLKNYYNLNDIVHI